MSSDALLQWILGVSGREQVRRARRQLRRDLHTLSAHLDADERAFIAEMDRRAKAPHLTLAETPDGVPFHIRLSDLTRHGWVTGSTGSGKTRLVLVLLRQLLARLVAGDEFAVILLGLEGDLVDLTLRTLGMLLERAAAARRDEVLSRLLVARFFRATGDATLPPWNILAPSPHVPLLVQAQTIAEILEHSLGAPLGSRQDTALTMLLALAIEHGLPVNALRILLHDREALEARASRSKETLLRSYFEGRFARESPATLDGIASRLDRLLSLDAGLRGALAGPGTIDFAARYRPGSVTCLDFSGVSLGGEGARLALSALSIRSLFSAALSAARRIEGPTLIVIDEAQLAMTPATLAALSTALTTIRHANVGIYLLNQSLVQLPRDFSHLAATNLTYRFLGRSGSADASLSAEFLPRTGRVLKTRSPFTPPGDRIEYLSRAEEEAHRVTECGALPRRTFFVTDRSAPFGVKRIVLPVFDPPAWESFAPDLRAALERGATGVPRSELVERARQVEAQALSEAARGGSEPGDDPVRARRQGGRARTAIPQTPDAVARSARWRRKGGHQS